MYQLTRNQLGWTKGGGTPKAFLIAGKMITAPKEMAEIQLSTLNKKLQKLKTRIPDSDIDPTAALKAAIEKWGEKSDERTEFKLNEITVSQTADLIRKLGNSRTYGNDELDATTIKIAAKYLIIPITHLMNQSMRLNCYPNQWKIAKIVPLHKGKGTSKFDPNQYRPISILPVLSKIMEKTVQKQMLEFLNKTNQLNRNHHSYREFHSTTTAMIQLTDTLYRATDKNLISTLLTIDESAAFECVSHKILLNKMRLYNFAENTTKWFESYLNGRSNYVAINGKNSRITSVMSGVPQGSILGPLMYILYINELPNILKNPETCKNSAHEKHIELFGKNCKECGEIPCYADDATVVMSSSSRKENQEKIVKNLKKISEFLTANELVINEDKTTITEVMTRQKRAKVTGNPPTLDVTGQRRHSKTSHGGKINAPPRREYRPKSRMEGAF